MPARPKVALIVAALYPSMGIGANGRLPWHLKKEMKYFKDVTSKAKEGYVNAVIMGRKTWDLIPERFRPLPGRVNIVLSRSYGNTAEESDVLHYNSFESVMQQFEKDQYLVNGRPLDKIFVIGGSQVYNSIINDPKVDSLLLTQINFTGEQKDTPPLDSFLEWDLRQWKRADHSKLEEFVSIEVPKESITEGDYNYEYTMWERNA